MGGSQLGTLYDRSRSYGFGIGLSVQHLKTLEVIAEDFRTSVIKNANIKVLFRQDEDAETYAGMVGTQRSFKETQQTIEDVDLLGAQMISTGAGSMREVNEFIVAPDVLRGLRDGQACFIVQSEHFGAERRINVVTLRNSDPAPAALPTPLSGKAELPASAVLAPPARTLDLEKDGEAYEEQPQEMALEFYLTSSQCAARISERLGEKTTAATFQKMVLEGAAPAPAPTAGASKTQKWAQTVIDAWLDDVLATRAQTATANDSPTETATETLSPNQEPVPDTSAVLPIADSVHVHSDDSEEMPAEDEEGPSAPLPPEEELTEPAYY